MKVAYLLGGSGVAQYTGKVSGERYFFNPWADDVVAEDWEVMKAKMVHVTGCCGRPTRQMRVFGSETEVQQGLVGFSR